MPTSQDVEEINAYRIGDIVLNLDKEPKIVVGIFDLVSEGFIHRPHLVLVSEKDLGTYLEAMRMYETPSPIDNPCDYSEFALGTERLCESVPMRHMFDSIPRTGEVHGAVLHMRSIMDTCQIDSRPLPNAPHRVVDTLFLSANDRGPVIKVILRGKGDEPVAPYHVVGELTEGPRPLRPGKQMSFLEAAFSGLT